MVKRDAAVCSQGRTTSETCPAMFTQLRSNTNKTRKPYRYLWFTLYLYICIFLSSYENIM